MSDNDANNILDGTVEEVKEAVQNMDDLDYEDLLNREAEGKDRKTIKDFLATKADSAEVDLTDTETEEVSESRSIFEKSSDSSAVPLAAAGVVIGLLIGLAAGQMIGGTGGGNPDAAADNVESLITSGGFNGTVEVGEPQIRNDMYYFNITLSREGPNGTVQDRQQTAYVSKDGVLLFPENPLTGIPINMPQQIQRQQQAPQNATR